MLSLDNYHIVLPTETRTGSINQPIEMNTKLGWVVFGQMTNDDKNESVFLIHNEYKQPDSDGIVKTNYNDDLHQMVKEYFSFDSMGVRATNPLMSR